MDATTFFDPCSYFGHPWLVFVSQLGFGVVFQLAVPANSGENHGGRGIAGGRTAGGGGSAAGGGTAAGGGGGPVVAEELVAEGARAANRGSSIGYSFLNWIK